MTTLEPTSRSVARKSVLSDLSVRAMDFSTSHVDGHKPRVSGQQSSDGPGMDIHLMDQYGPCSQRWTPCRHSRSDDCSPLTPFTPRPCSPSRVPPSPHGARPQSAMPLLF